MEKQEEITRFIDKIMPVLMAKNSESAIKFSLEKELEYLWTSAFISGQEDVLNKK